MDLTRHRGLAKYLVRVVLKIPPWAADYDDAVQEVMLVWWLRRDKYRENSGCTPSGWLGMIGVRHLRHWDKARQWNGFTGGRRRRKGGAVAPTLSGYPTWV